MKVAVRDDDTCYFTSIEDLKNAYGELWGKIPISLAVIPFVKARKAPYVPKEYQNTEKEYPIGENYELVSFLRKEIKKGNVSIMLHGYNHEYFPKPEFVAGKNLKDKILEGKSYLEETFNTKVKTFVPPSNSVSKDAIKAIKECGLNLLYYPTPKNRPFGYRKWVVFLQDLIFKYRESKCSLTRFVKNCYNFWVRKDRNVFMPIKPFIFEINGIKEFNCMSITEGTPIANVMANVDIAHKYNGCLCLSVHYYTLHNTTFRKKFTSIIDYISKLGVRFVHVDDFFRTYITCSPPSFLEKT